MEVAFALLAAHAVCDFVLQPVAMGNGKSRRRARAEPPPPDSPPWYYWLFAHALTHGGAVYVVTGAWYFGAVETALHAGIDHLKCERKISFHQDQACHVACKLAYVLVLWATA
jgi:hypothetical protein